MLMKPRPAKQQLLFTVIIKNEFGFGWRCRNAAAGPPYNITVKFPLEQTIDEAARTRGGRESKPGLQQTEKHDRRSLCDTWTEQADQMCR